MTARNEHIAKYFSHLELQEREDLLRLFEKLGNNYCGTQDEVAHEKRESVSMICSKTPTTFLLNTHR